jgi:DedD protein
MPDPIEPQLDELRRRARRRLIGAIVLALAAAVLVPMLLESDPRPLGEDVSVRIPPVDDSKFVSKLADKGKAPAEQPIVANATTVSPKAEAATPVASPAAQATPAKDVGAPPPVPSRALTQAEQRVISPQSKQASATEGPGASATTASKAPAPVTGGTATPIAEPPKAVDATKVTKVEDPAKPAAVPKAADAPKSAEPAAAGAGAGAYSVQLAAFADDKGANSLVAKLKRAGHPAYTEPYETSRGRVWRVRVGPYPSREAAESVRVKLKAEGQNGILAAAK